MSLLAPVFVSVDSPSPSLVGQMVKLRGRVERVVREEILLKAKISCSRAPTGCDFAESWIEGRVISPASPPRRCPKCKQRTIVIERGSIERPVFYKVVLALKDQYKLMAYVCADKFDQLRANFPYRLEERHVIVGGKLELLDEYVLVLKDEVSDIEINQEELEKLRGVENSTSELHSKLNFDDDSTKRILGLCKALSTCGGKANRQKLGTILGISEKTIDRMFTHHNSIRLSTGEFWNPFFETGSSYPAAFHSQPKTALTLLGECLVRVHEKIKLNEEREQTKRRRRSQQVRIG